MRDAGKNGHVSSVKGRSPLSVEPNELDAVKGHPPVAGRPRMDANRNGQTLLRDCGHDCQRARSTG
jgi:hypothetical protein